MGQISKTKNWADNDNVAYTDINGNFDTIYNEFNGSIDNSNIATNAAISKTKLDVTLVDTTGTQTLTNKALTNPTLTKPTVNGSIQALTTDTDGATVTFDLSASNVHTVVLGGNRTLALSSASVGQAFVLRLTQDATGSRTVTWFSTIKWPNGITPTLTTTASKTDVFGFICTSSGNYDGYTIGQNL